MWYFSQYEKIDDEDKQKWIERINSIDDIQDLKERLKYIYDLEKEFLKSKLYYDPNCEDLYKQLKSIRNKVEQELRELTDEPEFDFDDIYTIPEWIEWAEQTMGKKSVKGNIPYSLLGFDEIYQPSGKIFYKKSGRYEKPKPLSYQESEEVLKVKKYLQDKTFNLFNIDINKLSDPELWKAKGVPVKKEDEVDLTDEVKIGFSKIIDWLPEGKDEGVLTSFTITPDGISIVSEVSRNPMPLQLQKYELDKFMNDVYNFFPKDWNKNIVYIEGGDFKTILSGELDKNIKVYRMMRDEEFRKWEIGEIIPTGKYFSFKRNKAVGTDFSGEGFKNVFTFIVNRKFLSGTDPDIIISNVPLRLKDNKYLVQA